MGLRLHMAGDVAGVRMVFRLQTQSGADHLRRGLLDLRTSQPLQHYFFIFMGERVYQSFFGSDKSLQLVPVYNSILDVDILL